MPKSNEKTRFFLRLISYTSYLVFSLSIVNQLASVHSQLHGLYKTKKTEEKYKAFLLQMPRHTRLSACVSLSLAPKRRCSSHTFRYGYLVTT